MVVIALHTLRFKSQGNLTCRRCHHRIVFDEPLWFVVVDDGATLRVATADGLLVHRCGRVMQWVCSDCGPVEKAHVFRRHPPFCPTCYKELVQRAALPT